MLLRERLLRLMRQFGMDRAIAYTLSTRLTTILVNIGSVVLMLHFLSPTEQGYYFTLLSLAALQVVFELGFSFVIQQLAAHECAHLTIQSHRIPLGDAVSHARLASILQITCQWYLRATIALGVILMPLGIYFFSHNEQAGVQVSWLSPWLLALVGCMYLFLQNPVFAFLEGCGEICQVARVRLFQVLAGGILAWGAMVSRHGLFVPGLVMVAAGVVGTIFLWRRREFLLGLLRYPAGKHTLSWREEVWPFQWKIAISWLCTYFTMQVFTPMIFHYRNAVEAGQMGISISIAGYLYAIPVAWVTTKAPRFGELVAQRRYLQLDQVFFLALRQASSFLFLLLLGAMLAMILLHRGWPHLATRMVSPWVFAVLLAGTMSSVPVQAMAIYLRSFKREPFLWQSLAVATLTLVSSRALVKSMGSMGISLSYLLCTGLFGLVSATVIFRSWRHGLVRPEVQSTPLLRL
jgi:hypothetical protein